MDNGFLVCVLYAVAGLDEEFETVSDFELLLIAILRDGQSGDVLHYEIGLALRRRSSVEDLGDGWVIHDRERLSLRLKARREGLSWLQRTASVLIYICA